MLDVQLNSNIKRIHALMINNVVNMNARQMNRGTTMLVSIFHMIKCIINTYIEWTRMQWLIKWC